MFSGEKIFFLFDLETNGLPYLSDMNYKFTNNWPHTLQISWGLYPETGRNVSFHNYILKFLHKKYNKSDGENITIICHTC